jgi:hypothetical protein
MIIYFLIRLHRLKYNAWLHGELKCTISSSNITDRLLKKNFKMTVWSHVNTKQTTDTDRTMDNVYPLHRNRLFPQCEIYMRHERLF